MEGLHGGQHVSLPWSHCDAKPLCSPLIASRQRASQGMWCAWEAGVQAVNMGTWRTRQNHSNVTCRPTPSTSAELHSTQTCPVLSCSLCRHPMCSASRFAGHMHEAIERQDCMNDPTNIPSCTCIAPASFSQRQPHVPPLIASPDTKDQHTHECHGYIKAMGKRQHKVSQNSNQGDPYEACPAHSEPWDPCRPTTQTCLPALLLSCRQLTTMATLQW